LLIRRSAPGRVAQAAPGKFVPLLKLHRFGSVWFSIGFCFQLELIDAFISVIFPLLLISCARLCCRLLMPPHSVRDDHQFLDVDGLCHCFTSRPENPPAVSGMSNMSDMREMSEMRDFEDPHQENV